METTSCAVHIAFRTALLLAGATKTAELAVLDGIDACENISHRSLLIETMRSTIRRRAESPAVLDGINLLPPELRRLLSLQPSFGTALFFEFLCNCLLRCVRNFSKFPSPNTRTLYAEH
jgi:hypothetical protein